MSWREESTFKKASALDDSEKEFLKLAKKLRDVLKLEERSNNGEGLDKGQLEKVAGKDKMVKEIAAIAAKLPGKSEVFEKNPDVTALLPSHKVGDIEEKRKQTQQKEAEEKEKQRRREERERQERKKGEFMCRHDRAIMNISVAKDSKHIYTSSKDKYVICWSMANKLLQAVCTFSGHEGAVWGVDVAGPRLMTGAADGKVMFWKTNAKQGSMVSPESTLNHGGVVRVVRWCPYDTSGDSCRFATACEKLASTPTMLAVWRFSASSGSGGGYNHSGSSEKSGHELVLKLENQPTKANDLQWAAGAKVKLLSAHDNGYVGVWSVEGAGGLLKTIKLHSAPVASLSITKDCKTLLTASHDRTGKAVDISSPETPVLASYEANRPLNAVTMSDDYKVGEAGLVILGGGRDPMVVTQSNLLEDEFQAKVLDSAANGSVVAAGLGHFGPVHAMRFMSWIGPRGGAFATAAEDGCLKVFSAVDGSLLHSDTLVNG